MSCDELPELKNLMIIAYEVMIIRLTATKIAETLACTVLAACCV